MSVSTLEQAPAPATAGKSPGRRAWIRFRSNRIAMLALVLLGAINIAAVFAPVLAPYPPNAMSIRERLQPPSIKHPLGTDENGRDMLSRLLYGARISLSVGLAAVVFAVFLGAIVGGAAGFAGGITDSVLMRVTDGMLSVPIFFFMITTLALFGATLGNIILVIGATSWMSVARIVRGEVLRNREMPYVEAARSLGAGPLYILFRHVLPQSWPAIIVSATLGIGWAILMESSLSFLGLGVQPPDSSWGNMLAKARGYMWNAPLLAFIPGFAIFLTVLLYNWLGDGLRDALDPTST
ncbi:ABC transporter permease [Bosea sp. BK604]|uniref:ABC transporter permease n=1 Tax=Bosea sp. BK604 TaxID=2512180 RepID=UPI00104E07CB|nr:ABC transporter permease [Bosea sp. BK604]TCR68624.1 peptide/nickel transport system permease protein [Bosea sp. BK604]